MEKISRKIFQPNTLTNELVNGVCSDGEINLSDFINRAVTSYFTPKNPYLKQEMSLLFERITNHAEISQTELQASLARCVRILKDFPIRDSNPIRQIFYHFTTTRVKAYRYDYIVKVDTMQDSLLHRLNDILKTVDEDFILGTREFGERSRDILRNWDAICSCSEVYQAMAVLIECEDIYQPLDTFRAIDLIKWLDNAVIASDLTPVKTFETTITPTQKYFGIKYEISVYQTDNGYAALSGDLDFDFSPEIKEYYSHYMKLNTLYGEATETDVEEVQKLEQEGRMLFRRLRNKNKS